MSRPQPLPDLLALLAGAAFTLALAPFGLWPAALLSCAALLALLRRCPPGRAAWRGWLYGLGLFGAGASWVYVSIHDHGNAGVMLAGLLTALFCAALALLHALLAWTYARWLRGRRGDALLGFPALWVLFEWLRSWLLTGFPWLYAGYASLDTWGAGWAPVAGVFGASLLLAYSAACLYVVCGYVMRWRRGGAGVKVGMGGEAGTAAGSVAGARKVRGAGVMTVAAPLAVAGALWLAGGLLARVDWVQPAGGPLRVGIVQANIPQALKWRPDHYRPTLDTYRQLTLPLLGADLVLWPEAAVPRVYQRAQDFLAPLAAQAEQAGSALVTGVPWLGDGGGVHNGAPHNRVLHNSIVALGRGSGVYHKQRLVPFGEYVPLERWLRGLIGLFDLPMSAFSPGPPGQPPLRLGELRLAPFVCYEIVYPGLVRHHARGAQLLVTISNDSWFGASIGPLQHAQMARMRALENGRYVVRGTNNGVSAIIDQRGAVVAAAPQFQRLALRGTAQPMAGSTPFARLGSAPVLGLSWALLGVVLVGRRARP